MFRKVLACRALIKNHQCLRGCSSSSSNQVTPAKLENKLSTQSQPGQNGLELAPLPGPDEELKPGAYLDKDGTICIVPSVGHKNPYEFLQPFTPLYKPNPPAPRPRKTFKELMKEEEEANKPVWKEADREEIEERFRRFKVRTIEVVDLNVPLTVPLVSDKYGLVVRTNNLPGEPLIKGEEDSLIMNWFPRSEKNVAYHFQKKFRRLESLRTMPGIRYELKWRKYDKLVKNQQFIDARFYILGPDLSAAHFLIFRGAQVKFKGRPDWFTEENSSELPTAYESGWHIEEIDASGLPLVYEGLLNLRGLKHVKVLNLSDCEYVDDWCLDRIAGELSESLEEINLTGCKRITAKGIACLSKVRNLRHVELGNKEVSKEFHLTCLLLEDVRENNLLVDGINVNEQLLLDDVLKGNPVDGPEVTVQVKQIDCVLSRSIEDGADDQERRADRRN